MKYVRAIISTISCIGVPIILLPILQWYKLKFNINLEGVYILLGLVATLNFVITCIMWGSALKDIEVKDLLK